MKLNTSLIISAVITIVLLLVLHYYINLLAAALICTIFNSLLTKFIHGTILEGFWK